MSMALIAIASMGAFSCSGDDDHEPDTGNANYSDNSGDDPDPDNANNSDNSGDAPDYNGHEWVDLGLSVKWATCNIGASSPSDYGDYYVWGETTPNATYEESNSKTYGKSLGDISGNPEYDAARANWGGSWRLPTKTECVELIDRCTWTWMTQEGHNGYKVTGSNGNFIFLPAAGYRNGSSLYGAGTLGNYWSSTPYGSNAQSAYYLCFNSGDHYVFCYYRFGRSVRPVSE